MIQKNVIHKIPKKQQYLYYYIEGINIGNGLIKGNRLVFGFFLICGK